MLIWQDWVLTVANGVLMAGMCPMIMKKTVVPLETSIPTSVALAAFAGVYMTLGLVATSFASGISAVLWLILVLNHPSINKKPVRRQRRSRS